MGSNLGAIYWMDIWTFFTLICCKNWIAWLKRLKISKKEAGVGPFFWKKTFNDLLLTLHPRSRCCARIGPEWFRVPEDIWRDPLGRRWFLPHRSWREPTCPGCPSLPSRSRRYLGRLRCCWGTLLCRTEWPHLVSSWPEMRVKNLNSKITWSKFYLNF